jgi:hypothetical protein
MRLCSVTPVALTPSGVKKNLTIPLPGLLGSSEVTS